MTEETKVKEEVVDEDLNKSIDAMIDDLFAEEEVVEETVVETVEEPVVEKSMVKDMKPQSETADEGEKPPKGQKDEARGAGRPKQISDVPQVDKDGKRAKNYDSDIVENKKDKDGKVKEQDQVKPANELVKKAWEDSEEYKEYQELKKAKEASEKEEDLQKAKKEQADLIKSAVVEATSNISKENEGLQKKLDEQGELIKSMANRPQRSKAVTSVGAVEKSFGTSGPAKTEALSKSEVMDVAEELVKAKKITMEHAIELEDTGYIYEKEAREVLEREIKKRK